MQADLKAEAARSDPTSAGAFTNDGALQPSDVKAKRLEGLAAEVWTLEKRKRLVSSERHKTDQRNGVLCHAAGLAYVRKAGPPESGQYKKRQKKKPIHVLGPTTKGGNENVAVFFISIPT